MLLPSIWLLLLVAAIIFLGLILMIIRRDMKCILRPNLIKVIVVIVILLLLHIYFVSMVRFRYVSRCQIGDEECVKQEVRDRTITAHKNTLIVDLIIGLPIIILGYILIGVCQCKKRRSA